MRLQHVESDEDLIDLKSFSEWIASIGDGTIGGLNDSNVVIDISDDLLSNASDDPIASIVNNMYPNFTSNVNENEYLQGRAILALTLDVVETVNECSGVSNHELKLKVGTLVMLLRNIDHSVGLCNGTRLVITRTGNHILEAKILTGSNAGHKILIPRMTLTPI
ncbi:uncharacterized protein LOC127805583 [Diospyros lotus]|uniref:uncharacterized protein LOC127805583 n=1 Tax=Diospyros lotus TaxID=55363 RepID=UPI00224CDD5A|nr:uncharacterized protein LOC127805583 [Diospyros lotus]